MVSDIVSDDEFGWRKNRDIPIRPQVFEMTISRNYAVCLSFDRSNDNAVVAC